MSSDPWGWVFALWCAAFLYSLILAAAELPDRHVALTKCDKHPGTPHCVCRGNLPKQ